MQVIDTYLVFMCANLPVLYVIELYWNDQGRSKIKYFIADVPWSPWSMSIMPRGQLRLLLTLRSSSQTPPTPTCEIYHFLLLASETTKPYYNHVALP
jgi:hypothetical protein